MNSRPKLRKGARLRIQNFHSILFFEILLATALWSAPELPNNRQTIIASVPTAFTANMIATDTCAPVIECVNGLNLQPEWDGNVFAVIAATDLVTSSSSTCSDSLHFSIYRSDDIVAGTEVPNPQGSSSISLNCNQDCLGTVVLTVYAWDENYNPDAVQPDGTVGGPNYSICEAYVLVSGLQFCECGGSSITISGSIETDNGEGVANVVVQLSGTSSGETTTNSDGGYAFSNLAPGDYTVSPELDVFPLNGVTTFDVVLISRHILGIQTLGDPYKIIAADANNDRKITTVDLIHLRRLILAIDTNFASNTSWRFVPADYDFPVPTNPWFESFPEVFTFNDVINSTGTDFIAIKIGDVNNSADPDPFHSEEPAGRGALPERLVQPYLQPVPEYGANVKAVTDTCAPVLECVNGLAIELIPVDTDGDGVLDSGEYEVSALDMLAQPASSDCSDSLRISIHKIVDILLGNDIPNPDQGSLLLDCEDYAIAYVRIYAWDDNYNPDAVQPDGTVGGPNYSYCDTYIIVQANYVDAVCSVESGTWIGGIIETTQSGHVKGVHVQLSGYQNESDKTDAFGSYSFARLPTSISGHYTITPTLDTFPQNGLSTFDIILISRHILGIQVLDSPYKMIAADVNGDEKITTVDLIHLRRMVLGIDSTFASNTSWRFVSADYVFPVPGDPWFEPFPESKTVLAIFSTDHFFGFVGIKIGDVNYSADPS